MKRLIAAVVVSVFAFPAGALAASGPVPIAKAQPVVPRHLDALGTDVAAPDQQSPILESEPVPAAGGSDFDWGDAAIGAGGAICVAALSLGSALTFRRRTVTG